MCRLQPHLAVAAWDWGAYFGAASQKGLRLDYRARARAVQTRRKMADERNEAGVRVDRTGALFEERGRFAAP